MTILLRKHTLRAAAFVFGAALLLAGHARAQNVAGKEPNSGGQMNLETQDPEKALAALHLPEGYKVNLFASEKEFPVLGNPVAMVFDAKGRLWVSTMQSYPQRLPDAPPEDKLVILEDTDGDGKADKHTVFAGDLHVPTGFELGDGGAYISQQPNIIFARDTDGDDVADERETILHGFGTEDSHHAIHAFTWGPDGALYFQEGVFHHSQVETPYGPVRLVDAGVFRYEPKTFKLEVFVSYPFANPWGHVFDRWGQNFIADASGGSNYFGTAITGNAIYPEKRSGMKVFTSVVRPTCGCEIVRSRHFPDEAQGNFLVNNNIGFQGTKQHQVIEEASGFTSKELEPLLYSTDMNFRPVHIRFGPDGALYIVDWFNPLIGHMQYSLRDPRRDHEHGRIWRITYPARPLVKPPKIDGQSVSGLLDLLKVYEDRTRYRARLELRNHPKDEVARELKKWISKLDPKDAEYEHLMLEALWAHQTCGIYEPELLKRELRSPEPRARAAATRVLRHWRGLAEDPHALLAEQIKDENPRVRLEAVLALSYLTEPRSAEIALEALRQPTDYYLDYVLKETVTTLKPWWMPALGQGNLKVDEIPGALTYLLERVPTNELRNFTPSEPVLAALLTRPGIGDEDRGKSLKGLAQIRKSDELAELLAAIKSLDDAQSPESGATLESLGRILAASGAEKIAGAEAEIEKLRVQGKRPATRKSATAALISSKGSADAAWATALGSKSAMIEFLESLPLVLDAKVRGAAYPRVAPLLAELPEAMSADARATRARFVRLEIPGRSKILTIAEIEVMKGAENIARGAKASQSSTEHGGDASRATDGNTAGEYGKGGQTHTRAEDNPWLELDLGAVKEFDSIRIWNRTEDDSSKRLAGFRLSLLGEDRAALYAKSDDPAPAKYADIDPNADVRRAAILALGTMEGHGAETAAALLPFIAAERASEGEAALETLGRVPEVEWPAAGLDRLGKSLVAWIEATPVDRLSAGPAQRAFALGEKVASRLGEGPAAALRASLANLGITTVKIAPIPHKMVYDTIEFAVRAGKPVEIEFANNDIMPHNLVVTAPGSLSEIGNAAEKMAMEPGAEAKGFIPKSEKVLHATKLLYPGAGEKLTFLAPAQPGRYPFVCTFPGHWLLMNGVMRVEAELPKDPALLVKRREDKGEEGAAPAREFVKLWEVEELLPGLAEPLKARSFARGKDLFGAVGCNKCHVIGGIDGGKLGPDLAKTPEKFKGADLLRQIIDPSEKIEDEFIAHIIETKNDTLSGIVKKEDAGSISLAGNPLEPDQLIVIPKSEIKDKRKSALSTMPTGLLSTLREEEIFDLLAFVQSGGNPKDSAFAGTP